MRTEGEAEEIVALIDSVRASIDSVAILSSPETVETAFALVDLLRDQGPAPSPPDAQAPHPASAQNAANGAPTRSFVLGIGLQFLVIGLIALVVIAIGRIAATRIKS